jgi:D-alanine--poly(phosphoribitol) ligase subunit 2
MKRTNHSDGGAVDSAELSERILDRLMSICGADEVRTNLDLAIYDRQVLDSMRTVEFLVALEQEFGLYISPAELDRQMWATPRKIIANIRQRLKT